MKNRECLYCSKLFDCKERADVEYCLLFEPKDAGAEERYKRWRNEENVLDVQRAKGRK